MKKLIYLLFIITINLMYSQETEDVNKVFPLSPQAGSLGSYGNTPIDLSNGKISLSIPLVNIKVDDFEYPINLSYNYSGLQTQDVIGHVGMGWNISSSGYISVQVRGKSDFHQFGYVRGNIGKDQVVPYINGDWNGLPAQELEDKLIYLYSRADRGIIDTEPDKYVVNSGNLNFSFFIDEDGNPLSYPFSNNQISFTNTITPNFSIKDVYGNNYLFNNGEWTEINGSSTQITSFNLTDIKLKSGKSILFNYNQSNFTKNYFSDEFHRVSGTGGIDTPCDNIGGLKHNNSYSIVDTNIISEINYENGKVQFFYEQLPDLNGERLVRIEVKNLFNQLINGYLFMYSDDKKLLLEVHKIDSINNVIPFYKCEYFGQIPQNIHYASCDMWGFYNGTGNTNLAIGNKKAYFETTQIGALKKIIYPTKGYSEFEYELNTSSENPYFDNISNLEFANNNSIIAMSSVSNNYQDADANQTIFIPYNQVIKLDLNSKSGLGSGEAYTNSQVTLNASYSILDDSPNSTLTTTSSRDFQLNTGPDFKTVYLRFGPGDITLHADATNMSGEDCFSSISIAYNSIQPKHYKIGGLRVKRIKDFTTQNSSTSSRYFLYHNDDETSNGLCLFTANSKYTKTCTFQASTVNTTIFSGDAILPLTSNGNNVIYSKVKEVLEGNEDIGYKIHVFNSSISTGNVFPFFPKDKFDFRTGKKEQEDSNKPNSIVKSDKFLYHLNTFNNEKVYGFKTYQKTKLYSTFFYNGPIVEHISPSQFFNINYDYSNIDYRIYRKETTSFFHSGQSITDIVDYNYNSNGLMSSESTTNSKGETLTTKYFYPKDTEMVTEPIVGELISKNIIGIPLKTETYKSVGTTNSKLSETSTKYASYPSSVPGQNLLLPQYVYAGKESNIEKKITYDSYDTKGNILQYTPENGIPTSIIWGYNKTLPIAKIENATNAQVQTALGVNLSDVTEANMGIINALRVSLPNAMITTYTHIPLVGVSTITDPKGDTITYIYDSFNRLQEVKDKNGNKLSENQYHYRPQN